jgi:WD40 repeat protein
LTLAGALGGCGAHDTTDETPRAVRLQLPNRWNVATSAPVFSADGRRFAVLAERSSEKEGISDPSAFVWSRPEGERRRIALRNGDESNVALGRQHLITSLAPLFGRPSVIKTAADGSQERARIPHSGASITGLDVDARVDAVYVATSDSVRGIIVRLPLGAGRDARVGRSRGAVQALRVGGTGSGVTIAMLINNKGVHALRGPIGGRIKVLDFSPADPGLVARSIDLTPDGRRLAVGIDEDTPEAWDVARHHRLRQIRGVSGGLGEVALSPSGKFLALVDRRHSVVIWDINASEVAAVLRPRLPPSHYLMGLAWSARSEVAAATQGGLRSHPVVLLWHVPRFR